MTLETIEKQSTNKTYWVRFNEHSGKVTGILKRKPDRVDPGDNVVETDDPDAGLLLKGRANIKDFSVLPNLLTKGWLFSRKSKELELQPVRKKLEQVPYSNNVEENDVYITFYKQSMKAVVAINTKRVIKNNNLAMINDVVANEYSLLNLFICKRNDPDSLISVIEIDTKFLVKNTKIIVDIPESILQYTDIGDISLFVLPVFEKYGVNFVNALVDTPELKGQSKLLNQNIYNENALINIYAVNDNTITVTHNIQESQFNLFGDKRRVRFIVCDQFYDKLLGGFDIDVDELLSQNSIDIKLNFNVPEVPLFLYKNNNILVSYNGEKHEQND